MSALAAMVLGAALLALPAAGAPTGEARLAAFRAEARAQRQKLGLGEDAARLEERYPAPRIALPAGAEPAQACPGDTVTLRLEGALLPGSLVLLTLEEVEVLEETLTPTAWQARVRLKPTAPPRDVLARVVSPVSALERDARVLDVGCQHRWSLELPDGQALSVATTWPRGANTATLAQGEWRKGGATQAVALTVRGAAGAYTFERLPGPEEVQARARLEATPAWKALQVRDAEAQAKVNACARAGAAAQAACLKANGEALARVARERQALLDQALAGVGPRLGCERLSVRALGGVLSGEAERCLKGPARVPVAGTVRAP